MKSRKIVGGPGVYICSVCIDPCNEIISEEAMADWADDAAPQGGSCSAEAKYCDASVELQWGGGAKLQ